MKGRLTVGALLFTLLAAFWSAPAAASVNPLARAQQGQRLAALTSAARIFRPAHINRQVPSTGSAAISPGSVLHKRVELPKKRTRDSFTYAVDGHFATVIYAGPVNFKAADGSWQRIDNTLVADSSFGFAYRNRADDYSVEFPSSLAAGPIRASRGSDWVEFSVDGASGSATVSGNSITYAAAFPGVQIRYDLGAETVQESLTVDSLASIRPLSYTVRLSGGLTPRVGSDGTVRFQDKVRRTHFSFPTPSMIDRGRSAVGASAGSVKVAVVQESSTYKVELQPDQSWLAAPARRWPVVIDPALDWWGADSDCFLVNGNAADTHYCGSSNLNLGFDGTYAVRPLLLFDVNTDIPAGSQVFDTDLALYVYGNWGSTSFAASVYQLTEPWNYGFATWNDRDNNTPWSTPGGTFNSTAFATTTIPASTTGWMHWSPTQLVQKWVTGTANQGMILKQPTENVVDYVNIDSTESGNSSYYPNLTVVYDPGLGERPFYTYTSHQLSADLKLEVNVGNGNLLLHEHDFQIRGTGLNLSIDRYFNNLTATNDDFGYYWNLNSGIDIMVYSYTSDGAMTFTGPSGYTAVFTSDGHGGYNSPAGLPAKLVTNGSGWMLTWNSSGEKYNFNSSGQFTSDVDRNGNTISLAYNSTNGSLSSITDTQGRVSTFAYTFSYGGYITQITDPANRQYNFAYNSLHQLTSYTDPDQGMTQYAYDSSNDLTQITDPKGNVTKVAYDSSLRVTSITYVTNVGSGTGPTTTFAYNTGVGTCNNVGPSVSGISGNTVLTDANNHSTTYCYDNQFRVLKVLDGLNHTRETTYDPNSNVTQLEDGLSSVSQLTYDNNNNLKQITAPASGQGQSPASSYVSYTTQGQTFLPSSATEPESTSSNANGNCEAFTYDNAGNLTTVYPGLSATGSPRNCDGQTGSVAFTNAYQGDGGVNCGAKNGELCSTTDAKNNKTTYGYDSNGNLISISPPSPLGGTTITYDGLSRVNTITDGNGNKTTYSYDALDRIVQILYAGAANCVLDSTTCISYTYDADGNLSTRDDNTGHYAFAYDAMNRVTDESLPDATTACTGSTPPGLTFSYDGVSNLTSYCDQGGTTSYAYDAVNNLTSLAEPTGSCTSPVSLCTTFSYDNNDRRTQTTFPGGAYLATNYYPSGQQKSAIGYPPGGGNALTSFSYTYNLGTQDTALRQTMTEADPIANLTTTYTYDTLDRLLTASNSSTTLNYSYDQDGNRCSTSTSCSSPTYQYNGANELTSSPGVSSYTYDQNGNMTGNAAGASLSYNAKNQTTSITDHGGTLSGLTYADADQTQRTAAGSTTYANSPLGVMIEKGASGSTYYIHDNQGQLIGERTPDGNHWYFLKDGLGSVIDVISGDGSTVADQYAYDPYGQVTCKHSPSCSVSDPWQFAGGYLDSNTSLLKFGTRYYDPTLGRWTQQDPIGGSIADPSSVDRYIYAGDSPTNLTDLTGLDCGTALLGLGVSTIGYVGGLLALVVAPPIGAVLLGVAFVTTGASVLGMIGSGIELSQGACS